MLTTKESIIKHQKHLEPNQMVPQRTQLTLINKNNFKLTNKINNQYSNSNNKMKFKSFSNLKYIVVFQMKK